MKTMKKWATPQEIDSGIKSKVENGEAYIMRVGIDRTPEGTFGRWQWYKALGKEARNILRGAA